MPVTASIEQHPDSCAVVVFTGQITLGSSLSLVDSQVRSLISSGARKIVFDLSGVESVDSAGLGMLIYAYGSLKAKGGNLRLCGVAPRVQSLLELTNMNTLLTIDATREESLAALRA
ncbi:MAG TPA: STAS domain-containing protein [Terracidiphilus sp.]|nr:STAS domain-containing protein [Terracidiphilus sp.]